MTNQNYLMVFSLQDYQLVLQLMKITILEHHFKQDLEIRQHKTYTSD